ncbi:hypothetical protein OG946_31650 [Streptomyces sp. NBC_01808]|uniref:hypothetical protein n=1 Tax=Streptomyces sp. NBC_01808 TaxID=2975947 RepID=UPI002DDC8348|nr:hypothetical protein [Streptomyces sp. NBC_01808]WSA41539.1 hypothetical protein OG946_31650 [Streptomyces sp. NBC_01808]
MAAVVLGLLDPWLLAAALAAAAALLAHSLLGTAGRAARGEVTRAATARLSAGAVDTVDGLRELLTHGALDRRRAQLTAVGRRLTDAQRTEAGHEGAFAAVQDVLIVLALVGVAAGAATTGDDRLHGAWAPAALALALSVLSPVAAAADALRQAGTLRGAVALVGQDTALFHGTLRDNLHLAAPGADDSQAASSPPWPRCSNTTGCGCGYPSWAVPSTPTWPSTRN